MGYQPMSEDERRDFLRAPVRPAVLSTARADGRPHAAPVWYELDGDAIVFTTGRSTIKGRNITRDPRVALCVQDESPPFAFVLVEGIAAVSEDPTELLRWATRIGGRYMGADHADEYGRRNAVPGELLVRVMPLHVASAKDVAD